MNCTKCGSDNTQRLEVVFEQGTSSIETTSKTSVRPFFGIIPTAAAKTKTLGVSMSSSAQKAMPPQKKKLKNLIIGIIVGLVIVSNVGSNLATNWLWFIIGLGIMGICIWQIVEARKFNSIKWPELYSTWKNSWMCNKCGNIYTVDL